MRGLTWKATAFNGKLARNCQSRYQARMFTTQNPGGSSNQDQPCCGCGDEAGCRSPWSGLARNQKDICRESLQPTTGSCRKADSGDGDLLGFSRNPLTSSSFGCGGGASRA